MSEPRFYAVQPIGKSCAIVYDNDFGYDAQLVISGDFAEPEPRLAYAEAVAAALNAASIPTSDSASAVQSERCCLDYPRCDCNSPPEPDGAPALQPCGHPWKAQHDSKCILCSSPGPAHEECLGCSSPTTCEKYGCSVKRQRAIDSASGERDATYAQLAEEQRFSHSAPAVATMTMAEAVKGSQCGAPVTVLAGEGER